MASVSHPRHTRPPCLNSQNENRTTSSDANSSARARGGRPPSRRADSCRSKNQPGSPSRLPEFKISDLGVHHHGTFHLHCCTACRSVADFKTHCRRSSQICHVWEDCVKVCRSTPCLIDLQSTHRRSLWTSEHFSTGLPSFTPFAFEQLSVFAGSVYLTLARSDSAFTSTMLSDYTFREKIVSLVVLVAIFVQYYYIFLISKQTVVTGSYSPACSVSRCNGRFILHTHLAVF